MLKEYFFLGVLGCGLLASLTCFAEGVSPEEEYNKKYNINTTVNPLDENAFGEELDLKTGRLGFTANDVTIKGTGPDILIARSFDINRYARSSIRAGRLADWQLEIPRLSTTVPDAKELPNTSMNVAPKGLWLVAGASPQARCSSYNVLPDYRSRQGFIISGSDWWDGVKLYMPNQTAKPLLLRHESNNLNDSKLVTTNHWKFDCLPNTANGEAGEAFLATSPDGTKYWFDWMTYDYEFLLSIPPVTPAPPAHISAPIGQYRAIASLLPTRIQDRFGNFLEFTYVGKDIKEIRGSDGRLVRLYWKKDFQPNITHVVDLSLLERVEEVGKDSIRTWEYKYNTHGNFVSLSSVKLPNGREWNYSLDKLSSYWYEKTAVGGGCNASYSSAPGINGSIKAPSGLSAEFNFETISVTRNNVPVPCAKAKTPLAFMVGFDPKSFYQMALVSKRYFDITGDRSWKYSYLDYSFNGYSYKDTARTLVTNPDNLSDLFTFNNNWGASEGDLIKKDIGAVIGGDGSLVSSLSTEIYENAASNIGPYPNRIGTAPETWALHDKIETLRPNRKKEIIREGVTYTYLVNTYDEFGQPETVSRYNNADSSFSIKEKIKYYNNKNIWVISEEAERFNLDKGELISKNVYSADTGLLQETQSFNLTKFKYQWNSQGQLASYTDANGNTTSLSNYKLGVPQDISYPDGTSKHAVVDDYGQVVSITDQLGSVWNYHYDSIGRLALKEKPLDSISWLPTSYTYTYPDGFLRVTETTGSVVRTTLYDGMQRRIFEASSDGTTTVSRSTRYDWRGNVIFESYPEFTPGIDGGNLIKGLFHSYDALGRRVVTVENSEIGDIRSTKEYQSGNKIKFTDGKGISNTVQYQSFDEPNYKDPVKIELPGVTQLISRDSYGNPLKITQAGIYEGKDIRVNRIYVYDSYKRLCRTVEPEASKYMGYDAAGNVIWYAYETTYSTMPAPVDKGIKISRVTASSPVRGSSSDSETVLNCLQKNPLDGFVSKSYDSMNRLVKVDYPDATESILFNYDALGNISVAKNSTVRTSYIRNNLGLVSKETIDYGSYKSSVSYGYDQYGNVSTLTYPGSNSISFNPDAFGRPKNLGKYASNLIYFANGELKSFTYGNNIEFKAEQNERDYIGKFRISRPGASYIDQVINYDENSNVVGVIDFANNGLRNKQLSYDQLNRLIMANSSGLDGIKNYTYDPLNNIRKISHANQERIFNYSLGNLLTSISINGNIEHTFSYDNKGNMSKKDGNNLPFNAAGQLTKYMGLESYKYDAFGNRAVKIDNTTGHRTYYLYNKDGKLLSEYNEGVSNLVNYYYLNNKLIAKEDEGLYSTLPAPIYSGSDVLWSTMRPSYIHQEKASDFILKGGESLKLGEKIIRGSCSLIFQNDGNLVVYGNDNAVLWAAYTENKNAVQAVMQTDGNFVIYDEKGAALWHSNTYNNPGAHLLFQDTCMLSVRK
ncbi:hypothetical protein [Pseudomonas sp. JZ134]|uniref:hypothetical protein n=1 Tax=Pseudomonas sp. JZ134 TaxID=2806615 RepID=UPI003DA007C5